MGNLERWDWACCKLEKAVIIPARYSFEICLVRKLFGVVMKIKPIEMLLVMLAGWMNRHQQDVIEYLRQENKILREKLGKKRIILDDNQRMRLARFGERLGRKVLTDVCCIFSPDTLLVM